MGDLGGMLTDSWGPTPGFLSSSERCLMWALSQRTPAEFPYCGFIIVWGHPNDPDCGEQWISSILNTAPEQLRGPRKKHYPHLVTEFAGFPAHYHLPNLRYHMHIMKQLCYRGFILFSGQWMEKRGSCSTDTLSTNKYAVWIFMRIGLWGVLYAQKGRFERIRMPLFFFPNLGTVRCIVVSAAVILIIMRI